MKARQHLIIFSGIVNGALGARMLRDTSQAMGIEATIVSDLVASKQLVQQASSDTAFYYIARFSRPSYELAAQVTDYLEEQAVPVAVTAAGIRQSYNKFLSYEVFNSSGIKTPETALVTRSASYQHSPVGLPAILKPVDENKGKGIVVAWDDESYQTHVKNLLSEYGECIVQEFIAESSGTDIRAFVIDDTVVAAMERRGKDGSITANLSQGGSGKPVILTTAEINLSVRTAKSFGARFAGVDLIRGNKGTYVIEVNASPGFGIEEVCGIDVRKMMIEHLVGKA